MCGIASISRAPGSPLNMSDLTAALLVVLQARGTDAAGVAWRQDGEVYYRKEPVAGRVLAREVHENALLATATSAVIHTRWATLGAPSRNENNHPVLRPGVALVHNGSVRNHREVFDLLGADRDAEVDSEALAAIVEHGDDLDDVFTAFGLVTGSAAVAWLTVDESAPEHEVHLARIVGSPMVVAQTAWGDGLMASTEALLRQACAIMDVPLDWCTLVPEGTYVRFDGGMLTDWLDFDYTPNYAYVPPSYQKQPRPLVRPVTKKGRRAGARNLKPVPSQMSAT